MPQPTKVAKVSDIPPGTGKSLEVNGKKVAVFNVGGKFEAIDDTCIHRGGPLGEGSLDGVIVTCPWHHWTYEVTTGKCLTKPGAAVPKYPVKVEGDDIVVEA